MKEFYGGISFSGRASFTIRDVKDKEEATNILFEDIEGITLHLKDGSKVEITEINWDLISEEPRGNRAAPYISDLEIEEEK